MTPHHGISHPTPETAAVSNSKRDRRWPLIVSPLAVLLLSFEISYNLGQVHVDHTRDTFASYLPWFYLSAAISWAIRTYKKQASARVRMWALGSVLPLVALIAVVSFKAGEQDRYPTESRQLVTTVLLHAREVKRIKAEITDARPRFTTPEDLLTLQPDISALKQHFEEIDKLTLQIGHHEVPPRIAQLMTLVRQDLPIEKRQIANIESQIAVVRSAQGLSTHEKVLIYRQQLLPLTEQEEQIERERQTANIDEKIKTLPQ